jgi:hydrogenase maturation factor
MKTIVEHFQIGCVADGFDTESISHAVTQLVSKLRSKEAMMLSTQLNRCAKEVSAEVEDKEFLKLLGLML